MENKIADINDLVWFLAVTAMRPLQDDELWRCYGYKKWPKHGKIWEKIVPKMFVLENFISKEILTMGVIDVLNGVKKSTEVPDTKSLISIGVVDQFLSTTKDMFSSDLFMEHLFSTYASCLKTEKSEIPVPIMSRAVDILDKKDFPRFVFGTIKWLGIEHADDFLLKSDYIKGVIEKSSKENKLKISMSDETYKKYVPLIEEKILNA